MAHTSRHPERRKTKKSNTLSPVSVGVVQALRQDLERAIADYYDSLPAESAVEQVRWGEFATGEFSEIT
jgi:cytochrome c553